MASKVYYVDFRIRGGVKAGSDKLRLVTGKDWMKLINLGDKMGLGSSQYELINLDI